MNMIPATGVLILFLFITFTGGSTSGESWSYDNKSPGGPSKWGEHFPACKQQRQSPIDIQASQTVPSDFLDFLFSRGYYRTDEVDTILNNGHTVQLDISSQDKEIAGGGLDSTYRLVQLHMHWGSSNDVGSEHLLDGKAYPLAIHLVHYDVSHGSINAAKKSGTGLAVLGIMAKVGTVGNRAIQGFIELLHDVSYANTNITFNRTFPIMELLPSNRDNYFRYNGSLTTPPCLESVVWTVFQEPITVTLNQLKMLRKVMHSKKDEQEAPLVNNFRPVQKLNGRIIKRSFQTNSNSRRQAPVVLLIVTGVLVGSFKFM